MNELLTLLGALATAIATMVALFGVFSLVQHLGRIRNCPGCGQALVRWGDVKFKNGYRVQYRWLGCPAYRDLWLRMRDRDQRFTALDWDAMDAHYATCEAHRIGGAL